MRRCSYSSAFRAAASVAAAVSATLVAGHAHAAGSPAGIWLNDTGRGAIEIKNCKTGLCGHVVWVKSGSDAMGCGKQIIGDVKSAGGGTWDGGWIYSPERKKRYDVELEPQSDGTLKVTGFAGIRFLSKTMIWKPAPKNLVRCENQEAAVPPSKVEAPAKPAAKIAAASAAPAAPVAVQPKAETEPEVIAESEEPAVADPVEEGSGEGTGETKRFNLDDGIEVGDVFSLKKDAKGKCKIKAPFVDIVVDCDR